MIALSPPLAPAQRKNWQRHSAPASGVILVFLVENKNCRMFDASQSCHTGGTICASVIPRRRHPSGTDDKRRGALARSQYWNTAFLGSRRMTEYLNDDPAEAASRGTDGP
jgi:hypothetical protein